MKKITSFLFVVFLVLGSFTAQAQVYPRGDVNQDGLVNISDVTCLINYLLTDSWPDEPVTPEDHEWVDLGLPSGTLWATCNVGANVPEEYGDYFAWGETEPQELYDWSTYKWCFGDEFSLTKYCHKSDYGYNGYTDDKTELDPEDDAAYVNWGPSWRMPSAQQLGELYENCIWTWTQLNGVNGYLVTGPNGNTLFLPAGGGRKGGTLKNAGIAGSFWSRTLTFSIPYYSFFLGFIEDGVYSWSDGDRCIGVTVRAVRVPQD